MPRVTLPIFILLILLFFTLLGQSYFETRKRAQRLDLLKTGVETLQDRKAELEEDLSYRQSPTYIEREAREQLGYTKKGEVIVVLPDLEKEKEEKGKGEVAALGSGEGTFSMDNKEAPIWKRWGCLWIPSSWACP